MSGPRYYKMFNSAQEILLLTGKALGVSPDSQTSNDSSSASGSGPNSTSGSTVHSTTKKIVVVGTKGSGKSDIILNFIGGADKKLGALISWKRVVRSSAGDVTVEVAECEELQYVDRHVDEDLRSADGFILVFSVNSRASFEALQLFRNYILRLRSSTYVPSVMISTNAPPKQSVEITPNTGNSTDQLTPQDMEDMSVMLAAPLIQGALFDRSLEPARYSELLHSAFVMCVDMMFKAKRGSFTKPDVKFRYSMVDTPEIQFSNQENKSDCPPIIKAATIQKLVERATYEKHPNTELVSDLLISYRAFAPPQVMLDLLISRFFYAPRKGLEGDLLAEWQVAVLKPIRLRVITMIRTWIENYYEDWTWCSDMLPKVTNFAAQISSDNPNLAATVSSTLKKTAAGTRAPISSLRPPPSRLKNRRTDSLLDVSSLECARQMSLLDHEDYCKIRPMHCLHASWHKNNPEMNPVTAIIKRFNGMSSFIMSQVLGESKLKNRVKMIEKCISIADKCKTLQNYNGMMMVSAALENTAIYRLKETWRNISKKRRDQYQSLRGITSCRGNYANLRAVIAVAPTPYCPYLGVYLSLLLFIDDGNPDYMAENPQLINWDKWRLAAAVIKQMSAGQQVSYNFEAVHHMQKFLSDHPPITEEEAYQKSYTLEPGRSPLANTFTSDPSTPKPTSVASSSEPVSQASAPQRPGLDEKDSNQPARWAKGRHADSPGTERTAMHQKASIHAKNLPGQIASSSINEIGALVEECRQKLKVGFDMGHHTVILLHSVMGTTKEGDLPVLVSDDDQVYAAHYASAVTANKSIEATFEKFMSIGANALAPKEACLSLAECMNILFCSHPAQNLKILVHINSLAKKAPPAYLVTALASHIMNLQGYAINAEVFVQRYTVSKELEDNLITVASQDGSTIRVGDADPVSATVQCLEKLIHLLAFERTIPASERGITKELQQALEKLNTDLNFSVPQRAEIVGVVNEINEIISQAVGSPVENSGLLGEKVENIRCAFLIYLDVMYQYCAGMRDEYMACAKQIQKLSELRSAASDGRLASMGFAINIGDTDIDKVWETALEETRKKFQQVNMMEATSNNFLDWALDNQVFSKSWLQQITVSSVKRVFDEFLLLHQEQRFIEELTPGLSEMAAL